jgi:hypothetical protein
MTPDKPFSNCVRGELGEDFDEDGELTQGGHAAVFAGCALLKGLPSAGELGDIADAIRQCGALQVSVDCYLKWEFELDGKDVECSIGCGDENQ